MPSVYSVHDRLATRYTGGVSVYEILMNSKKMLIGAGLVLVALAFAAGSYWSDDSEDVDNSTTPTPSTAATTMTPSPTATPKPVSHAVRLTATGPVPKTLTIRAGDSVSFTNEADFGYWIASDPHPTHDRCPGFDARRPLAQGDTYSLTFTTVRTCTYHSHNDPNNSALKGTIIVQ
jgi:plastocyanin